MKEQRDATQKTFLNMKGAENPIGGQKGAHGNLSCDLAPQPHLAYSRCSFIATKQNGLSLSRQDWACSHRADWLHLNSTNS